MNHLTATEFVDALDGTLDEGRLRHLDDCAMCSTQIGELRSALASGLGVDQPEPSPLFWESFPDRVNEGLRRTAVEDSRWMSWLLSPRAFAAAAALIVLTVIGASWQRQSAEHRLDRGTVADSDSGFEPNEVDSEEGWAAVRAAAENVPWDQVHDAGLSTRPGHVERALSTLTDRERARLIALIEEDLKKAGD